MRFLRILYVITDLEIGGVPLHLARLAGAMRRAGHDVGVVSLAPVGPVVELLAAEQVPVWSCAAFGPADWRVFDRLAARIQDFGPDLVHALLFHANVACRLACILAGFPTDRLVCEIQTVEIERRWHLVVDRWTHRWCRLIIGNSPSVVTHLHEHAGVPLGRLRYVAGGVDAAAIHAAQPLDRQTLEVAADDVLLLWAGRLDPIKGLDTLLEAVDLLRRQHPVRCLLAGEGPERANVERLISRRDLGEVVTLLGRRSDVHRLMRTADVFVFPSRTEGMPNALLEAMAAGLPIVTTDVAGCRDLVTDGQEGLLVPPDDPPALAGSMTRVIVDRLLAKQLSDTAWHTVASHYTLKHCTEGYIAVYKEATTRPTIL